MKGLTILHRHKQSWSPGEKTDYRETLSLGSEPDSQVQIPALLPPGPMTLFKEFQLSVWVFSPVT